MPIPWLLALLNSNVTSALLQAVAPTIHFQVGDIAILPVPAEELGDVGDRVETLVTTSKLDWDDFETSWEFRTNPLIANSHGRPLVETVAITLRLWGELSERQQSLEEENNRAVAKLYDLAEEVMPSDVPLERVSLPRNTLCVRIR